MKTITVNDGGTTIYTVPDDMTVGRLMYIHNNFNVKGNWDDNPNYTYFGDNAEVMLLHCDDPDCSGEDQNETN